MREATSKEPELLIDMREKLSELLVNKGIVGAAEIALDWVRWLSMDYGGQQHYIPQGVYFQIEEKHWKIYEKFNGANYHALSKEYKMSEVWIREICKRCSRVEVDRRQGKLFGDN